MPAATACDLFEVLLGQIGIGVIVAERDGRFSIVNDVARSLFERHCRPHPNPESWVARPPIRNEGLEPIHWIVARVLLTGEVVREEEIEFIDERDEWRTLSVSATPIADDYGEVTRALVTFTDVTAINRARDWEPLIRSISRL